MATITPRGKRWRAQVRRRGQKPLSATFETKARAREWAIQKEAEILAGKRGEYPRKTFADALDKYLEEESPKKAGLRWEKIRIEAFKRSTLAPKQVSAITEADIAEWRNGRLKAVVGREKRPITGATVRREMGLIASVLDVARREWKWCEKNAAQGVTKPPSSPARRRGVISDAVDLLAPSLSGDLGIQVWRAFCLALETAMRKGEILSLEWPQVSGSVAHLARSKNGDQRWVALSAKSLEILDAQRGLDPVKVFTVSLATADTLFRKAVKAAGIEDLHFHDSRSEAITRLSKKLDVLELARQVGHRDLKSLLIYYAPSPEDMAKKLG